MAIKDLDLKTEILGVMNTHVAYGHKRIAMMLKTDKNRILRVMKIFNLKPYRRNKNPIKRKDINIEEVKYKNLIKLQSPIKPNIVCVSDFKYIRFKGTFVYLATIIDTYTKKVLGWSISKSHNALLVIEAFNHMLINTELKIPRIIHSDQGSEYRSESYTELVEMFGTQISMSKKGSPWENGMQESFFSRFEVEFGDPNRFENYGELIKAINQHIIYYNKERIHTSLRTTPELFEAAFCERFYSNKTGT